MKPFSQEDLNSQVYHRLRGIFPDSVEITHSNDPSEPPVTVWWRGKTYCLWIKKTDSKGMSNLPPGSCGVSRLGEAEFKAYYAALNNGCIAVVVGTGLEASEYFMRKGMLLKAA